jgi:hypothetical protein
MKNIYQVTNHSTGERISNIQLQKFMLLATSTCRSAEANDEQVGLYLEARDVSIENTRQDPIQQGI